MKKKELHGIPFVSHVDFWLQMVGKLTKNATEFKKGIYCFT